VQSCGWKKIGKNKKEKIKAGYFIMFYITEFFGLFNKKEPFEKFYTIPPKPFFKTVDKDDHDIYVQTLQKIMNTPSYKCLVMAAVPSNNPEKYLIAGFCGIETGPIKKGKYRKTFLYIDVTSGANIDFFFERQELFSSIITTLQKEIKKEDEDILAIEILEYNFRTIHQLNLQKVKPVLAFNVDTFEIVKKLR